jgi:WD40 repeat protein
VKQRVLSFKGRSVVPLSVDAPGPLRWVTRESGGYLLVGDRGAIFRHEGTLFERLRSPTTHNLRCAAFSPKTGVTHVCGNDGIILAVEGDSVTEVRVRARENLRRLAWDHDGDELLLVGNDGAAYLFDGEKLTRVTGADTHLRSVSWHPSRETALVTGNCFRDGIGGLAPSPNLFELDGLTLKELATLEESRADLTSSSWHPDGRQCLVAGFDQTWHTPVLFTYSDGETQPVDWKEKEIFPTACSWSPDGSFALLGTSAMTSVEGPSRLYRLEGGSLRKLEELDGFGVSSVAWAEDGTAMVACSRSNRAFTS